MQNELKQLRRQIAELEEYKARCLQLEKALQQSEDRFTKIFHASANLMAINTMKEGRFIDLNAANAAFNGFKREEMIGKTMAELSLMPDEAQTAKIVQEMDRYGRACNLEVQVRTKDGNLRTILFSSDPITVNDEPCLLTCFVDITDREKEAEALRISEERYRILVENSLQGLAIIQDSHIVFCNKTAAEISGYSIDELLSLSPAEISKLIQIKEQDIWDRYQERITGKNTPSRYECRGITKDGTEKWLDFCVTLIEFNGKSAVQAAFLDITESKKTAETLRKSLEWQRAILEWQKAIFEGSRDAIMISDIQSHLVDVNEAACILTGYSREELLKMEAWDLNKEVDRSDLELIRKRILGGEDVLGETEIFTKEGVKIDVEFSHRFITIAEVPYMHSIARDITNRKRLEAQFMQAQKMEAVGALAGGVAHDFNNLLSVIKGYTELLLEETEPDDPKRKDLEQVEKAGQQAAYLISHLLAFSRKQILQPEYLNLNQTVNEMSTMLRRLIGENIELITINQPDLGPVYADPGQLHQVIMNLAVNARDAMPSGGRLIIETANVDLSDGYSQEHPMMKAGSYVMIAISDDGIGMSAATQARIFEPFFTTKEKGKGTGLGLSTVYGIVKQSNGFVWVYSEPGKGTTFKIYFPAAINKNAKMTDAQKEVATDSQGNETILVVEDEALVLALAGRILRDRGYTVLDASNGKEALEVVKKFKGPIHLVLTDVIMPEMGGKELVARLQSERPDVKALYVSGYTDDAIVHHGILDAGIAFLQKPFSVENLAHKVREVLDSAHS